MEGFFSHKLAYVVLTFAALSVPAAAAVIAYFWYKIRREEVGATLKRELLDRGLTPEEVRMVVEASSRGTTDVAQDLAALSGTSARPALGDASRKG